MPESVAVKVLPSVSHIQDAVQIVDAAQWNIPSGTPMFAWLTLERVKSHLHKQVTEAYKTYFSEGE
jgi:hypothetical protein